MPGSLYSKLRRITSNQLYFPEIDGIRFLAIMLVLLYHCHGYIAEKTPITFADNPDAYHLVNTLLKNGDRGVQLFFMLSGFILCLPFAHHYLNNGKKVSLKRYYLRRVTRLEPPYFIAMTGLFLLLLISKTYTFSFLFPSLMASLVYLHNIIYQHTPYVTVVAWSLEIEIQFYLLAPLLFKVLTLPATGRRLLLTTLAILFVILQHFYPAKIETIYNYAQFFILGILLADVYVSNLGHNWMRRSRVSVLALMLFLLLLFLPIKYQFYAQLLFPFVTAAFYYVVLKNDTWKNAFSYKFIPIIGGMCYSIYLLHYALISIVGRFTIKWQLTQHYLPNLAIQLILILVPTILICSVYYYFIERPFMAGKWTDKLMGKSKKNRPANPVIAD